MLFKVLKRVNHDFVTYEPDSIHEFPSPQSSPAIQTLVESGVLMPIEDKSKEDLDRIDKDLSKDKPKEEILKKEVAQASPPPGAEAKVFARRACPKCNKITEIVPEKTVYYIQGKTYFIKETCAVCGRIIIGKANEEEHKKIAAGTIKLADAKN